MENTGKGLGLDEEMEVDEEVNAKRMDEEGGETSGEEILKETFRKRCYLPLFL